MQERPDGLYLIVAGEIDYSTPRRVRHRAVQAVLTGHPGNMVLDLTAVLVVSSEGVSSLVDAGPRAAGTGTKLTITTSPAVYGGALTFSA